MFSRLNRIAVLGSIVAMSGVLGSGGSCQAADGRGGVIEGYIRDDNDKPVKGVRVEINQGSFTTQGHSDVIPLFIPHTAVGAIVINDPNRVDSHEINGHASTTDSSGHYRLKGLLPGTYSLAPTPEKRNFSSGWGELVVKEKLARQYEFPQPVSVNVKQGEVVTHNVVLPARKAATLRHRKM